MGSRPAVSESEKHAAVSSRRTRFERRIIFLVFLLAVPGLLISAILLWLLSWSVESKVALFGFELFVCLVLGLALHEHIIRPLQTLSNVVAALREEDYSFRARNAVPTDALGELSLEVNALADMLADQRTRAIEATALLRKVVEEIDVPIFAFDPHQILQLVNSAGEKLLQTPAVRLMGRTAEQIGLRNFLAAANESLVPLPSGGSQTRWLVRR